MVTVPVEINLVMSECVQHELSRLLCIYLIDMPEQLQLMLPQQTAPPAAQLQSSSQRLRGARAHASSDAWKMSSQCVVGNIVIALGRGSGVQYD